MGVIGLTSFVARHERALATPITCDVPGPAGALAAAQAATTAAASSSSSSPSSSAAPSKTLVVDAWAFVYHHWYEHFGDAIRGGDFAAYQHHVSRTINAWRLAGLHPIFVFDGPYLPAKLPAVLGSRIQVAASNSAFMRSSTTSRRSRRFQKECGVVPPLLQWATVEALTTSSPPVETIFAPTEADSLVAELAEQTRGYAVSHDSDFFILCARGGQSAGYVSLQSFEYLCKAPAPAPAPEGEAQGAAAAQEDDGFAPVVSKKRGGRKPPPSFGIPAPTSAFTTSKLPPDPKDPSGQELAAVRFSVYGLHSLAKLLQLPPSLLPLFAAFVGNDYSRASDHADILFRHVALGPERVSEAAEVLRAEWDKTGPAALARKPASSGSGMSTPKVPTSRKGMGRQGPSKLSHLVNAVDGGGARGDGSSESGFSGSSSAAATPTGHFSQPDRLPSAVASIPFDPVRALVDATIERALKRAESVSGRSRYVASGEKEQLATDIIEAAATYSLLTSARAPHLASPSAAFFGATPSDLALGAPSQRLANRIGLVSPTAIQAWRAAYEKGHFDCRLVEVLTQRIFISRLFVEDPDTKSAHTGLTRQVRAWTFAVLFDAWGMSWARETMEEPKQEEPSEDEVAEAERRAMERRSYKEGERPDDVISVDTESSYSLAGDEDSDEDSEGGGDEAGGESLTNSKILNLPTRPGSVVELMDEMEEEENKGPKPPPAVTEWVRKGERFAGELVQIRSTRELLMEDKESGVALPSSLAALLGEYEASRASRSNGATSGDGVGKANHGVDTQTESETDGTDSPASDPAPQVAPLLSLPTRLDIFLHAHGACTPAVKALPTRTWPLAAALRHILLSDSERLGESRRRFAWTKGELRAAVASGLVALIKAEGNVEGVTTATVTQDKAMEEVPPGVTDPTTRAIHLASTIQLMLETTLHLAQALLLVPQSISPWPHHFYDAQTFHTLLVRGREREEGVEGDGNGDGDGEAEGEVEFEGSKTKTTDASWTPLHSKLYSAVLNGDETLLAVDVVEERREKKERKKREAILAAAAKARAEAARQVVEGGLVGAGATRVAKKRAEAARSAFAALGDGDGEE